MRKNEKVLSVIHNGIEYRCEQYDKRVFDQQNSISYWEDNVRSIWVSKNGNEIDDDVAMKLYRQKYNMNASLVKKLWGCNYDASSS